MKKSIIVDSAVSTYCILRGLISSGHYESDHIDQLYKIKSTFHSRLDEIKFCIQIDDDTERLTIIPIEGNVNYQKLNRLVGDILYQLDGFFITRDNRKKEYGREINNLFRERGLTKKQISLYWEFNHKQKLPAERYVYLIQKGKRETFTLLQACRTTNGNIANGFGWRVVKDMVVNSLILNLIKTAIISVR